MQSSPKLSTKMQIPAYAAQMDGRYAYVGRDVAQRHPLKPGYSRRIFR